MLHSAGEREKRDGRLVWTARSVIHQFQQALRLASASDTLPIPFSVDELRSRYQAAIPGGRGGALTDERVSICRLDATLKRSWFRQSSPAIAISAKCRDITNPIIRKDTINMGISFV